MCLVEKVGGMVLLLLKWRNGGGNDFEAIVCEIWWMCEAELGREWRISGCKLTNLVSEVSQSVSQSVREVGFDRLKVIVRKSGNGASHHQMATNSRLIANQSNEPMNEP